MYAAIDTLERVFTEKEKAALKGELFVNRELVEVDFSGADLRCAHFERTMLLRCNLAGADLRGATFVLCEFRTVSLADAVVDDNRFDGSLFVDVAGLSAATRALIERGGGSFQQLRASLR